jgi:hypothetical protein
VGIDRARHGLTKVPLEILPPRYKPEALSVIDHREAT